jgi:hypothetical protein
LSQRLWFELPSIAFVSGLIFGLRPTLDFGAVYLFGGIVALYLLVWAVRFDEGVTGQPRHDGRGFRFLHDPKA